MTMVAGVHVGSGVMLCADSMETDSDYAKRHVNKVQDFEAGPLRVAIAGSGSAPYIDMLTENFYRECLERLKIDDVLIPNRVSEILQEVLTKYYAAHVWPRGAVSERPDVSFVVACNHKSFDGSWLFCSTETAVTEVDEYVAIGIGKFIADYIIQHFWRRDGDVCHAITLGAYLVWKAGRYIQGCGGAPQVYFFPRDGGNFISLWKEQIEALEKILESFDDSMRSLFRLITDGEVTHMDLTTLQMSLDKLREIESAMRTLEPDLRNPMRAAIKQSNLRRSKGRQ